MESKLDQIVRECRAKDAWIMKQAADKQERDDARRATIVDELTALRERVAELEEMVRNRDDDARLTDKAHASLVRKISQLRQLLAAKEQECARLASLLDPAMIAALEIAERTDNIER